MNLMIVDDDIQIREGIRYGIDWESIGIGEVRSYGDGVEALEDFDSFCPKIILADIRMPAMDGLEFLKCVKERSPAVKVILISAYSDFEYCQKAIHLGASGYELKPLKVGSLISKIQEMEALVRKEEQGKEAYERYVDSYREKMVRELFEGRITDRNVIIELLRMYFQLEDARNLVCMVLAEDPAADLTAGRQESGRPATEKDDRKRDERRQARIGWLQGEVGTEIRRSLESLLREDQTVFQYCDRLIVLSKTKDSSMYTLERQNHLKNIWYQLSQYGMGLGVCMSAGISGQVSVERLHAGYEEALSALEYRFLNGPGSFKILDGESRRRVGESRLELCLSQGYESGIKAHDLEAIVKGIDEIGEELKRREITDRRVVRKLIMNGIVRLARETGQDGETVPDWEGEKGNLFFLTDYLDCWKKECRRIMTVYEESRNSHYSANIRKALVYIQEHYDDDLLVEEVAGYIGKTPNYFSSIFRTEVGITFREYLNRYRIERAREMIEESDMMIYEIAEKVGYSDYTYFSQVFKKLTGISPTSLRGRMKK